MALENPLSREWYPFIFGLKHDLLMAGGDLPSLRIIKTQTAALSGLLSPLADKGHRNDQHTHL